MELKSIQYKQFKLEQLIKFYLPYFRKMASGLTVNKYIKDELICEGNISIWKNEDRWQVDGGLTYNNFIITQAKYAMLNYLNTPNAAQNIYVPYRAKEEFGTGATISLSTPQYDDSGATLGDNIPYMVYEDQNEETIAKIASIKAEIENLKPRHKEILQYKYIGCMGFSDTEIAQVEGVSKQFIGQIVDKSLKKIQQKLGEPQLGNRCSKQTGKNRIKNAV